MQLNNMINLLRIRAIVGGTVDNYAYLNKYQGMPELRYYNGSSFSYYSAYKQNIPMTTPGGLLTSETQSINGYTVAFGTGTTPVTADDYTLEAIITDGLALTINQTCTYSPNANNPNHGTLNNVIILTITNTGDANKTISEIGFYEPIFFDYNSKTNVMLHREVLDTPITLAPKETKNITFTFSFERSVA